MFSFPVELNLDSLPLQHNDAPAVDPERVARQILLEYGESVKKSSKGPKKAKKNADMLELKVRCERPRWQYFRIRHGTLKLEKVRFPLRFHGFVVRILGFYTVSKSRRGSKRILEVEAGFVACRAFCDCLKLEDDHVRFSDNDKYERARGESPSADLRSLCDEILGSKRMYFQFSEQ